MAGEELLAGLGERREGGGRRGAVALCVYSVFNAYLVGCSTALPPRGRGDVAPLTLLASAAFYLGAAIGALLCVAARRRAGSSRALISAAALAASGSGLRLGSHANFGWALVGQTVIGLAAGITAGFSREFRQRWALPPREALFKNCVLASQAVGACLGLLLPLLLVAQKDDNEQLASLLKTTAVFSTAVLLVTIGFFGREAWREIPTEPPEGDGSLFAQPGLYLRFCLSFGLFRRLLALTCLSHAALNAAMASAAEITSSFAFAPLLGGVGAALAVLCGFGAGAVYRTTFAGYSRQSPFAGLLASFWLVTAVVVALSLRVGVAPLYLLSMALFGVWARPVTILSTATLRRKMPTVPAHVLDLATLVSSSSLSAVLLGGAAALSTRGETLTLLQAVPALLCVFLSRGIDDEIAP